MELEQEQQVQSILIFTCYKRGKNTEKEYQANLIPKFLILTNDKNKTKYELPIELTTHIKWEVEQVIKDDKKFYRLVAFKFQSVRKQIDDSKVAKVIYFRADDDSLSKLKGLIRNYVIFQRIQDVYTPLQTLGMGSSARILLVRNKQTEIYYAAKCIDKAYLNESDNGMLSIFQEIRISRQISHPSFINLHAVYEGDNTFYLVMDLIKGKSLHDELKSFNQGFPIEICKIIMLQILNGVEYLHSLGIMHRDLKPQNIMLKRKNDLNSLKIVDFGLAAYINANELLFPKCGTPGYVAPEIANLENKKIKYDKVCDIFSVGVIFFKIITGQDLFPGIGFCMILKLNRSCIIDTQPLILRNVPQNVINLILRMLQKDPLQRPSAYECLQDPFFQHAVLQPTLEQKKLFFRDSKNQQIVQSAEFEYEVDKTQQKQFGDIDQKIETQKIPLKQYYQDPGSFVRQDNAFQSVNDKSKLFKKIKFNTTDFGLSHPDQNKQDLPEGIEEDQEEQKID